MKILLITQGISRIVNPILGSAHDVVGIIESAPRGYKHNPTQKFLFLVRKILGTFNKNFETLKRVSRSHGIPYRFMTSSDDEGLSEWVCEKNPDLIVVFSMSQLLKSKIFDLAKYGAINLHPSYLPAYRGPNPDFWQYVDMEMRPGITVHQIDMGEDTGPIILQDQIELELGTKSPDRLEKLISELGVNL
jgi:methionyl-tRNA formyltransferase